ncbi:MAG: hypothetical protein RR317_05825 [Bilophila sp.]
MEISGFTQTGTRLLDALEKMGASPGAELRSASGPLGLPPVELVQAFEAALNNPTALHGADRALAPAPVAEVSLDTPVVNATDVVSRPADVAAIGDEPLQKVGQKVGQEAPPAYGAMQESLAEVLSGSLSPEELFRLQYHAGVLKVQGSSGKSLSQTASEGLESLLKQQG